MPRVSAVVFLLMLRAFGAPAQSFDNLPSRADTVRIYFATASDRLSPEALKTLDSALYFEALPRHARLRIVGYADYRGSTGSNQRLSEARAAQISSYLMKNGFRQEDLIVVLGKGELEAPDEKSIDGVAPHRRVDVVAEADFRTPSVSEIPTSGKGPELAVAATDTLSLPEALSKAHTGQVIRLGNIYFPSGYHVFDKRSRPELDHLVQVMKAQPQLRIRVEGHVCCIDTTKVPDALDEQVKDFALSSHRARYVAQYLLQAGISKERIEWIGFGKKKALVYHEKTEDDAARNRRVEIRILSK